MKRITFILILLIGLSAVGQNEALFEAANKAYNEGEYTASIAQYEKILEQGQHSAELYYNLGNAHYKLNQIAPSIYYYEKALLLKPNDPEIKNNLAYANNMTLDAIDTMPEMGLSKFYNRIVRWFTFDQWAYVGVFGMLLFVLLYIVFYFFHDATRKRIAFILSIIGLLVSIFAVAMAFVNYADFNSNQPAIVFDNEIAVRSEPNERGEGIFILHEGTKVNVLESLNGYQKIKIADGKTGWLPKESIKLLKDF